MGDSEVRIIVVVGMHRSGTSVIARGLQVIGVDLGNRLMPPFEGNNSKGFWEDIDINNLNIEMLRFLKTDWHFLRPIEAAEVETLCKNGYLRRALALLHEKTADTKVFGFKDPRVAKLLPFWKEVFAHGQWSIEYVLAIRHPRSVCQSLAKRDGFEFEKSYLLWLEYTISSLVGTVGQNLIVIDYDRLMQMPEREITRIAKKLQLSIDPLALEKFKTEFLDQQLQHTIYQMNDLTQDNLSPPLVREVYSSLLEQAADKASPEEMTQNNQIDRWNHEFSRLKSILMFADKLDSRIATITAERNTISFERDAIAVERDTLLKEKAQMTEVLKKKEQVIQKLGTEIQTMSQSRSWRWTELFRKLLSRFQRGK